jgi:hypothetical protein
MVCVTVDLTGYVGKPSARRARPPDKEAPPKAIPGGALRACD